MPAQANTVADGEVLVGRVSTVYGIKGWLRIHSYTEPRDAILAYRDWTLELGGDRHRMSVAEGRKHGSTVVVRLDGVTDRDTAATLIGAEIRIRREQLPALPQGQYYWGDLQGMQVRHRDGRSLGSVAYLMATGANDVLVVQAGDREILIPFVAGKVVLGVDTSTRVISVDWEWD